MELFFVSRERLLSRWTMCRRPRKAGRQKS